MQYRDASGQVRADRARLIDFDEPRANDLVAVNQFTIKGQHAERRPDVVLFVNGLPMVVMELKHPGKQHATLHGTFNQIQIYRHDSRTCSPGTNLR